MDMGVGVIVPMRMPVVMGVTMSMVVVMMGGGRGGNHAKDVIL